MQGRWWSGKDWLAEAGTAGCVIWLGKGVVAGGGGGVRPGKEGDRAKGMGISSNNFQRCHSSGQSTGADKTALPAQGKCQDVEELVLRLKSQS